MLVPPGAPIYPAPGLIERGLDLLFPPVCAGCRRVGRWICLRCWQEMAWILAQTCARCHQPTDGDGCTHCPGAGEDPRVVAAAARFEGTAREAVHVLKYHRHHAIAPLMGRLMADAAGDVQADVIVPVPLHPSRQRERGFDQAVLLARRAAHDLRVPIQPDGLKRIRKTSQQSNLDALRRRENVEGAFAANRHFHGERVLLVDDVMTTGSTLTAASKALKQAGSGPVVGLVFARTTL